jgi:hypothetical protein
MEMKTNKEWKKEADQLVKKHSLTMTKKSGRHDTYQVMRGDECIVFHGTISHVVFTLRRL